MIRQSRFDSRLRRGILLVLVSLTLADCGGGGGANLSVNSPVVPPNLSNLMVAGSFNHKDTVTVTGGAGFGVKASAAPVVWDDASGANVRDKWSGYWPNQDPTYNIDYRIPQRGIGLPHTNISRYIAGAHYGFDDPGAGNNVMFWKNRTIASYPAYTYASWYQRIDDEWVFQDETTPERDNNLKSFDYSSGLEPFEMPNNWYLEYNPRPSSPTSGATWHINDDGNTLQIPDANGHSSFWSGAVNPMSGVWTKIEQEIKYSRQSDGYIKLWENGVLKINYAGATDLYSGNVRTEGIGGYARSRSTNNWRYFADAYLDYTPARVVLANNAALSLATIVETQIPTSWSDTSITFTVNLGKFTSGQIAYLFVVNTSGLASDPGFPLAVP